jgi:hypothetical protein
MTKFGLPVPNSAEQMVLERMWVLHTQLNDARGQSPELAHIKAQIHTLAKTYGQLVDAKRGARRRDFAR